MIFSSSMDLSVDYSLFAILDHFLDKVGVLTLHCPFQNEVPSNLKYSEIRFDR